MKKLLLTLLVFPLAILCAAQSIQGKVVSRATGEAIPFSNVYLAGGLIGTVSDEEGIFLLEDITPGYYDLVVSNVAYEDVIINVFIEDRNTSLRNLTIALNIKALQEVVVKADTSNWEQNFLYFKRYFIGTTANAKKVSITNPEVLAFYFDPKSKVLYAHGRDIIEMENHAFGYRIYYDLKKFQMNTRTMMLRFEGISRFEEMEPKSRGQLKRWENARELAYKGSFEHFLNALDKDCVQEEGFMINKVYRIENSDRPPQHVIDRNIAHYQQQAKAYYQGKTISLGGPNPTMDSLRRWKGFDRLPQYVDSIAPPLSNLEELHILNSTINYKGIIQLTYLKEKEELNYAREMNNPQIRKNTQTSLVNILQPNVRFSSNGYFDHEKLVFEGYLGWYTKLAEQLPVGYQPTE